MEELLAKLIGAGPAGISVVVIVLFLRHMSADRAHREQLSKGCHDHSSAMIERVIVAQRESQERFDRHAGAMADRFERAMEQSHAHQAEHTRVMADVSVHLQRCAESHQQLEATIRTRVHSPN